MATQDFTFGNFNPGKNEVELVDVFAIVLVGYFSPMIFGVMSFSIDVFGGYDMTAPIWTVGGADISAALIIVTFSSFWIIGTNLLNSDTDHSQEEMAIFATALLSPILFVMMPPFEALVLWHELVQVMFSVYVIAATVLISYLG
ncbi:hypothetical protein [Natrialba sp. SSL1]|uniref:hypothetical protein n=1 Tax=Natrialba sp. SSL1 TaxID=1869245 RepID=UPI0008F8F049|nr:hypothetical protein [Natrialba sp. SSL1]OIB56219.1 hypothetical protein BBD46_18845 [Natrialba sp. SSL1]